MDAPDLSQPDPREIVPTETAATVALPECKKGPVHTGYRAADGAVICCLCDEETDWRECDACCGDGCLDGYEEDPINFGPGEEVTCHMCRGTGGDHVCTTKECETVTILHILAQKP